jgi:uncharacterized protein with gpF-like domain
MSLASKFFKAIRRFRAKSRSAKNPSHRIPTVKFDTSRVTDAVKTYTWENITLLEDIEPKYFDQVYDAALRSISAGQDLSVLYNALLQININGMTKRRAADIALLLNNKATALMNRVHHQPLGITRAIWLYSGAPCELNPKNPTDQDIRQDAAHRAANGKQFEINAGMFLDGKRTWPGVEPGCRCSSRPVVHGFS